MPEIICVGSGSKDVFFPLEGGKIMDNPEDITAKKLLAFELGAKIRVEDRFEAPGGCAVNVSAGLSKLGISAGGVFRLGKDAEGKFILENLKSFGADVSAVQEDPETKTDLAFILVDKATGERTIFFNRDANEKLEIETSRLSAPWIFVSSLSGRWQENLDKIASFAEKNNVRLIYNPGQSNLQKDPGKVRQFIGKCHILMVNRDEAVEIVGKNNDQTEFLLDNLKKLGPKIAVITDGEKGANLFDGEEKISVNALSEKQIDSTGAGDAFSAGFMAAFLKRKSLEESLKWGVANGGNVVRFYGAQKGLLNEKEMEEKIKAIKKIPF